MTGWNAPKSIGIALAAAGLFLVSGQPASAMPRNARQAAEGYWVGNSPSAGDVADMADRGIQVMVSAVVLDEETRRAARRHGIARVNVWFGNNFPETEEILGGLAGFQPEQIYIHCDHGGDRAGALLAFLLVVQQGWRPDHALLAVANPGERDVRGLVALLEDVGFEVTDAERAEFTGIYSGAMNGGTGGLKIRGPDYRNLVRTMLDACAGVGVVIGDPVAVEPAQPQLPLVDERSLARDIELGIP